MAKNKKAQILTAIMCASTVACVYPAIPAYAETITIDGQEYEIQVPSQTDGIAWGENNSGYVMIGNNGYFNITRPSEDMSQISVFKVSSSGEVSIGNGRLLISPGDESAGISFMNGKNIMDATGNFVIGKMPDGSQGKNKFTVYNQTGNVETEGSIVAVNNITTSAGNIEAVNGDVLSHRSDFSEPISLNKVGFNTQAITYKQGSGGNSGTTEINSILDVNSNKITNVATPTASSPGTDAANKMYVDNAIKGVTYEKGDGIKIDEATETAGPKISVVGNTLNGIKVEEQYGIGVKNGDGIGFDSKGNVIVKTAEDNSGLDFDDDGNMYVAVKENAGLNVDHDGLSVNADNGLEINSGALQVKAGKGLQINSATKELEAFSSDPNIIIDETAGITLNPELTNMTSISFKSSDVSISASGINAGNKEIKNVLIDENSTDDVAVNKGYVDDAVKNATGKTYTEGQGIAVDNNGNTISVKTTDENSGLKFTTDGKMSVAIGEQSGLVIDNNALSVNTGDGLTVEDNKVKIKLDPNDKNLIFGTNGVLSLGQDLKVSTVTATGNISGNTINGVTIENLDGNDAKINGIQLSTLQGAGTTYTEGSGIDIGEDTISVQTAKNDNNKNVSGLDFDKKGGLKVVSADSNIQVGTDGIKLNPELTNITSIDGAAISQVGTNGLKIANVTLEKGSVSAEAGSDVTIGAPAKDNIYSLKKVADKVSGINVDEEGNIIGGIAGWSYNNETNTATIGTSENGVTINGNTKDITGTNGNATLNGVGIFTGTQEADNKGDILLSSGEQEINVTDMNTDVTNLKTVTTGISYNEGNDLTTVDNNVQINKNLTVGGTSTFGTEGTQTSISNNGVTVADNATEQAAGTTDVKIGEGDKYSLRAIGDKIDGLNIDEDIDLSNVKGITRTGDNTTGYTTNVAEDDFAVGDKFNVDNATGNVTGGTYNGVGISTGTQEAGNEGDILLSSSEQEINVTDMNTDVTNLKTVTTGISYNEGNDLTTVDNNVQINKNLTVGGTSTFGTEGTQTSISNNGVTVADNATEQAAGTTDVKIGEGDKYSLRAIGDKIDGLNIDEDIDLRNIKGITRTGDETTGYTTNIAEDDFAVGDKFDVDNATGNVTGGTYNGVEIKTTPNTSTETPDDVDAVINGANVNEIDRTVDDISSRVKHIDHIDADEATGQKDTTVIEGSTYISSDGLSIKNNDTDVFNVDTQGNITASNGDGKGIFTMAQDGFDFGFGGDGKASFTMNDTGLKLGFGTNSFTMNADGSTLDSPITFKGKDGEDDITVIDGDTITTNTLNVNTINLSGEIIDSNGTKSEGTLTIRKDGYINADYTDSNGAHSHFTNDKNGVNSEYTYGDTTATSTTGNISDNTGGPVVGVKDQVGDNTSSVMTDGQIKDTVGNNTVTTTDGGTKFENGTGSSTNIDGGSVTVTGTDGNSTMITGDNITTGHITTDSITTGSINIVNEDGSNVHIGNDATLSGTIKDDLGNSFTYENTANGYYSEAMDKDGNSTVTNVNADGSITHVTDKEGNNAETNISADNINNTVSNGKNSASTNLDANGFTVTDSKSSNTATITGDDVVINTGKNNEIKLSDMGQISDIDSELQENSKFENNQTVVGAINAEADIRRNEIARIDNNIEQLDSRVGSLENRMSDVEERIDKVGAMAAAIANLRTMGYDPEAPTEIAVGVGQYKSETGLALGIFHYPNQDFMLSASISTSGDEVMGGIGATWKLGRKSSAEKAQDIEEKRIQKAEEMQKMAREEKVKAQRERHAQLLAERQHHSSISDGQSA
ncbi:YadA-like family protein [Megamonas hypermegale]|uniref:YadA-like family protein n=1 Tax=Megamonas hypermegale TaxID=158847 RepID=UPI0026EF81BF|nr:YadA-like family protein [Megamonas hypermegale]